MKTFVLLAVLMAGLLLNLGERPVSKIQEVRVAETAREMVATGDWLLPRYNGEYRLQKPPVPYWLTAASYKGLGINETAARLPAVLMGMLTALVIFCWLCRQEQVSAAANTVIVLATSYLSIRYLRSGEADAMLMFFIASACILGFRMLQGDPGKRLRLLFGLALGLGFLTKGPAALAVPLLTLLAYAALTRSLARLKSCFSVSGILLLLLTAFGWYAWLFWKLPDAAQYVLSKQIDETFVSGTHAKSPFWYLAHFFEFFAPWGFLLVPAAWRAIKQARGTGLAPHVRFAWTWLAVVFVLLMLTVNKQMQYAVLFVPAFAILLGDYLAHAEHGFARLNRVLFLLFLLAILVAIGYAWHQGGGGSAGWIYAILLVPLVAKAVLKVPLPGYPILLVGIMTVAAYLYSESNLSREPRKIAAQAIASRLDASMPTYQSYPGDGAFSFYAGRVIPPVVQAEMPALLAHHPQLLLISQWRPDAITDKASARVEVVEQVGDVFLYKVQKRK